MPPVRGNKAKRATDNGIYTIGRNQFRLRKGDVIPASAENVIYNEDLEVEQPTRIEQVISNKLTPREGPGRKAFKRAQQNEGALESATPPSAGQQADAELAIFAEEEADDAGDVLVESPSPAQEAGAELALTDPGVDHVDVSEQSPEDADEYRAEVGAQESAEGELAIQYQNNDAAPVESTEEAPADETASDDAPVEQAAETEKPAAKSRKKAS